MWWIDDVILTPFIGGGKVFGFFKYLFLLLAGGMNITIEVG